MAIRDLPTKTDDSLGRPKSEDPDRAFQRVIDLDHEVSFEEVERWKDLLIALAGGDIGTEWSFTDDFFEAPSGTWVQTLGGSGAVTELNGDHAGASDGVGHVMLSATAGGDAASIRFKKEFIRGEHSVRFRARVLLPASAADGLPIFGLYSVADAGASKAMFEVTAGHVWRCSCASQAGTGSATSTTSVSATATWHDLRIEIDALTEVRFYVDDVLVATLTTANAMPRTTDQMAIYFACTYGQGSGGNYVIDYVDVRGLR